MNALHSRVAKLLETAGTLARLGRFAEAIIPAQVAMDTLRGGAARDVLNRGEEQAVAKALEAESADR